MHHFIYNFYILHEIEIYFLCGAYPLKQLLLDYFYICSQRFAVAWKLTDLIFYGGSVSYMDDLSRSIRM